MSKKLILLILGLVGCLCIGCAVNPITGEQQFMLYSEQNDIDIGRKVAPEIEKQLGGRIADEGLQNYIDSVGQRIARVSHKPHWEYHFVAVEHKTVNALALPGGYIFVTKGILKELQTEAQLAALLSHELVHSVARHSSAAMSRATAINLLLQAVLSKTTSQGALIAADVARLILDLQYSREHEREADLAGLDYMVAAGYNPNGAVELQQTLQEQSKIRPIEFLSTHPSPENRLIYLKARVQTRYASTQALRTGKEDYHSNVLQRLSD